MPQKQRKSRDKADGEIPENDGVGGKRKHHGGAGVVSDPELVGKSDPERELNGEAEITEKKKKKKRNRKEKSGEVISEKESGKDDGKGKMEGNKDAEVRKGDNKSVERREDGDGAEGKLEDGVNKEKKKNRKRGGTEDEKAEREKKEDSEKGGEGGETKGREDTTKKDESVKKPKENRGSKNGNEDRSKSIAWSSEGRKVEEDEVRKSSKKQREIKDKDVEKASLVLALSRSMQQSRRDSPNKKDKEKADGNGKKPSEPKSQSKKRKSSEGEIKDVTVPTSSAKEELEEGANKAEKGKRDGSSGFKKKWTSGEKADEKDPKSCHLPLNRVRTIMRSHISISKVTQESYFLICKATECFIDQFCEDAFELAASHGLSKVLKYEHLSSLVYNMDRYDFLSDYVPQKIKRKMPLRRLKL